MRKSLRWWVGLLALLVSYVSYGQCTAISTYPYLEDFDGSTWGSTTTIDPCWTRTTTAIPSWQVDYNGTSSGSTGPASDVTGGNYIFLECSGGSLGNEGYINTPYFDLSSLTNPKLAFYYHKYGQTMGDLVVEASLDSGATWCELYRNVGETHFSDTDPWTLDSVDLTLVSSASTLLRFTGVRGSNYYSDMAVDSVAVYDGTAAACGAPICVNASGVTASAATIDWTAAATSYELEYGSPGFAPGTGAGTSSSHTSTSGGLTGLTQNTVYDVYVRSVCGGAYSDWTGPVQFRTTCSVINTFPYLESFDSTSSWSTLFTVDQCWSFTPAPAYTYAWQVRTGSPSTTTGAPGGNLGSSQYMNAESSYSTTSNEALMQLPILDLTSLTTPELKFYYFMFGASMGNLYIDGSLDSGATWTPMDSIVGQQQTSKSDSWLPKIIDLSGYNSAYTLLRFRSVRGTSFNGDISIDDVSIREQPLCGDPVNFASHNITSSTADITFDVSSGASRFVEWGPTGYSVGTGTQVTTTSDTVNLTGIPAGTCIDIYIQGDCSGSGNGVSTVSGPYTICTAYVPNYLEDWNSGYPGADFTEAQGPINGGSINYGNSNWVQDSYGNSTANTWAARMNIWSTNQNHWMVSPSIDLGTGNTYNVEYDVAWTEYSSTLDAVIGVDDTAYLVISTDNGATWDRSNILAAYHQGNPITAAGTHEIVSISYSGIVKFGFWASSFVSNEDTDFFIDNFEVRTPPACQEPFGFATSKIDPDSVWYSFDADTSAVGYVVEWGPCGYAQGTGMTDTIYTDSSSIGGLAAATCYDVYIKTLCGSSASIWAGPFSFTSGCDTLPLPWNEGFESTAVSNLPACWDYASSGTFYTSVQTGTSGNNPGPRSGSNYLRHYYSWGNTWWSFTPEFSLHAGQSYEFSFWYQTQSGTTFDELGVAFGPGQTAADMIYQAGSITSATSATYTQFTVTFIPPTTGVYHIGIKTLTAGYSGIMNIDDINLKLDPNPCPNVSALGASIVSENEVDLSWGGTSAHMTYDIEWGPQGFTPGTGQGRLVTGLTSAALNIDTLSENTCYDFYVTGNCSGGATAQIGPYTWCTPCSAASMPYTEDFAVWPPNCVDPNLGTEAWNQDNGWAEAYYWGNNDDVFIMSMRNVDITVDARVKFKWSHSGQYVSSYPWDDLAILARVLGTSTWDTLFYARSADGNFASNDGASTTSPGTGVQEILALDASTYTGNVVEFLVQGNSDYGPSAFVDDFIVEALPSCPEPYSVDFLAGSETSTSGIVYFDPGGASDFNIAYGPASTTGTPAAGSMTNATNDTVTLTGLLSNTVYNVWVRDSCAPGDVSAWTGPVSFRTACAAITTFPYIESFDGSTWGVLTTTDPCWTVNPTTGYRWQVDNNNTSSSSTGPLGDQSGSGNYLFTEASTGATGAVAELTSPLLDVTSLTVPELSFYYHFYGATIDRMYVEASADGVTWHAMDTIIGQQQTASSDPWIERTAVIPTAAVGTTTKIRFRGIRGSSFYGDMSIDQVSVREQPACPSATNLGAYNITHQGADVYWDAGSSTATNWIIEYGMNNFALGTGTVVNATNDTTSLTGLNAATQYCYYVTEICPGGADTAFVAGPYCFATLCPPFFSAPYMTDLEVLSAGNVSTGPLENCWTFYNNGPQPRWETEDATGANENSLNTGPFYDHTNFGSAGGMYIYLETSSGTTGDTAVFQSPWIDVASLNTPEVAFWYHMYGSAMGDLVLQARDNAGTAWTSFDTISGQQQIAGSDPWLQRTVVLTSLADTVQIRFIGSKGGSTFYGDMALDDIEVREAPTCPSISAVNFTAVSTTGSTANWTASVTGQTYEIEYGMGGFTQGSGTSVAVPAGSSYTFSGLPTNLQQEMYIRPICGVGDTGQWTGPFAIEMTPVPCDDFEAYNVGLVDEQSVLWKGWAGDGGDGEFVANGGSQVLHIYDSGTNGFSDIVGEFDTITSGVHVISFDFQLSTGQGGYYNILHNYTGASNVWAIEVLIDANGTATVDEGTNGSATIGTFNINTSGWNTIQHVIDLDNDTAFIIVNGAVTTVGWQFSLGSTNFGDRFNAVNFYSSAVSGQTPNYYVDNFCVCEAPSQLATSNASCTSVDLAWNSSAASSVVEYGPAGFTLGSGTVMSGTSPMTISGLTAGTSYDFYVGDECSGDTLFVAPVTESTTTGAAFNINITHNQDTVTATYATYSFFSGATGADSLYWDFGGATASGDSVSNTYGTNGTVTVTLTAYNDCGDTTITYTFDVENISIEESALGRSLKVYPNPSTGVVNLNFTLDNNQNVEVYVLNGLGQRVVEERLGNVNSFQGQFDLSNLPKGVYILQVNTGTSTVNRRVTLQ